MPCDEYSEIHASPVTQTNDPDAFNNNSEADKNAGRMIASVETFVVLIQFRKYENQHSQSSDDAISDSGGITILRPACTEIPSLSAGKVVVSTCAAPGPCSLSVPPV